MAIPLLEYAPSSQNQRVAGFEAYGDEQARVFSTDNILSTTDMDALIEASYRQIFFHAFAADREKFLESQLRSGQITVRDFIRGLCLSRTFTGSFFNLNSNYRFVEHCINKVLGRAPYSEKEKIAWSIVIATKGRSAFINQLLDSDEYLTAFGYDRIPKSSQILIAIQQLIDECRSAFCRDDNGPSDFFLFAVRRTSQYFVDAMLNEAVVAI